MLLNDLPVLSAFDDIAPVRLHNVDAEEMIIGGILLDPHAIKRIADKLPPEAFFISCFSKIFTAALDLHRSGQPTDLVSVATKLRDLGQLEAIGGQARLVDAMERSFSAVNIDHYAALVVEKYLRRRLVDSGVSIAQIAGQTDLDISEVLHRATKSVESVQSLRPVDKAASATDLALEWFDRHGMILSGEMDDPRLKTGFYDLDSLLGGGIRAKCQLIGVIADTGCGKTSFALQVAWNIAKATDDPVIFFSLEMEREELTERLISAISGISTEEINSPHLSEQDYLKVLNAMQEFSSRPNFYIDDGAETIEDIRASAGTIAQEHGGKIAAVFVDYFQLIKPLGNSRASKVEQLVTISQELKRLSRPKGLDTTIVVLAQVGRDTVKNRQNKRPTLHDTEWCASFEKDVNGMLALYNDENYNPDTDKRGVCEVSVLKNRSGKAGGGAVVELLFDRRCTRFLNASSPFSALPSR